MNALRQIAVKMAALNIQPILQELWTDTFVKDFIIEELNQNDQLRKGLKANGMEVGFYRSDAYAELKQLLGSQAPPGVVDLVATGNFYSSFDVIPTQTGFQIVANTGIYDVDFADKYGEEILGLSEQSIQKLRLFVLPIILEKIYEQVFNFR